MSDRTSSITAKRTIELLTPSSISSVFCVIVSLIIALGVIFINRYKSSSLSLEYQYYQAHKTISNSHLTGTILQNGIVKNLPLIFFWAIVGVIVYLIALDIVKGLKSAVELREELNYVHVHRKQLIQDTVVRLGVRVIVLAVWLPYLIGFFNGILPYSIRVAILATTANSPWLIAGYIVLSVVISSVAIHINLVFLRLSFLKARLVTNSLD